MFLALIIGMGNRMRVGGFLMFCNSDVVIPMVSLFVDCDVDIDFYRY